MVTGGGKSSERGSGCRHDSWATPGLGWPPRNHQWHQTFFVTQSICMHGPSIKIGGGYINKQQSYGERLSERLQLANCATALCSKGEQGRKQERKTRERSRVYTTWKLTIVASCDWLIPPSPFANPSFMAWSSGMSDQKESDSRLVGGLRWLNTFEYVQGAGQRTSRKRRP